MQWQGAGGIGAKEFTCGYCGRSIASVTGYHSANPTGGLIYICPNCTKPTVFLSGTQMPGVAPGAEVPKLPEDIEKLYREARNCAAASCYTAAVLVARKLLMNIAVAQGAAPGLQFIAYVEHLADAGFIPPNGKGWVDHIRKKGNEATHEIRLMSVDDATDLIAFLEMLLKFIYEFPSRVPPAKSP